MLKLKKAFAVALFGIGFGASISAVAGPFKGSYEECVAFQQACWEGDVAACENFDRYSCWRWDI